MIERIIDWSARNGFLVGLATFFLMGWGIWAVLHTPLDALPDLSDVQVIVFTEWPGGSDSLPADVGAGSSAATGLSQPGPVARWWCAAGLTHRHGASAHTPARA